MSNDPVGYSSSDNSGSALNLAPFKDGRFLLWAIVPQDLVPKSNPVKAC